MKRQKETRSDRAYTMPVCYPHPDLPFLAATSQQYIPGEGHYHRHRDAIEIQFIHSGSGFLFIKNRLHPLYAHSLALIHPGETHTTLRRESGEVMIQKSVLIFSPDLVRRQFDHPLLTCQSHLPHHIRLGEDEAAEAEVLLAFLQRESERARLYYTEAIRFGLLALLTVVGRVLETARPDEMENPSATPALLEQLFECVEKHFREDLTLEDAAAYVARSPYHISHLFREAAGITFKEYLTARRIFEARRLLEDQPDSKLYTVALDAGFGSVSAFNRAFRRVVGMPPSRYRTLTRTHGVGRH